MPRTAKKSSTFTQTLKETPELQKIQGVNPSSCAFPISTALNLCICIGAKLARRQNQPIFFSVGNWVSLIRMKEGSLAQVNRFEITAVDIKMDV